MSEHEPLTFPRMDAQAPRAPDWMKAGPVEVRPASFARPGAPELALEAHPIDDAAPEMVVDPFALRETALAEMAAQLEAERAETQEAQKRFVRAAKELGTAHLAVREEATGPMLELAVAIAEAIIGTSLDAEPELNARLAEHALSTLDDPDGAKLRVSPDALEALMIGREEQVISYRGADVPIIVDPSLEGLGCIAESKLARVDARVAERLKAVRVALVHERLSAHEEME